MKKQEEENLDRLFKQGLQEAESHVGYDEHDWEAMENMLDSQNKRKGWGYVRRLSTVLTGIAATLLLVFGMVFMWPAKRKPVQQIARIKTTHKPNSGTSDQVAPQSVHPTTPSLFADTPVVNRLKMVLQGNRKIHREGVSDEFAVAPGRHVTGKPALGNELPAAITDTTKTANVLAVQADTGNRTVATQMLASATTPVANPTGTVTNPDSTVYVTAPVTASNTGTGTKKAKIKPAGVIQPLTLSILAAPDYNGVGSSFNRGKVGVSAGLLLSVGVSRRLTVSTGVFYAQKPYKVGFSEYQTGYQFPIQPVDVTADCRVLDIPLNVNYQLYNRGSNLFSIGTGLSSYFMLRENYQFIYPIEAYISSKYVYPGPSAYNISNQNRHLFGVLNLNASYQRRLNANLGINIQPYMKVPLTNIGYGKVNLQSTGLAVGISWYLIPPSKKQ